MGEAAVTQKFIAVKVEGLQEFEANLKILREEFGVRTGGIINRGLMAGARLVRNEARRRAPVLQDPFGLKYRAFKAREFNRAGYAPPKSQNVRVPGNLKHNIVAHYVKRLPLTVWVRPRTKTYIFANKSRPRGGADPSNLVGNPNYWWLVEFGTSKMRARPFMRPAFEAMKGPALEAFKVHVRKEIDKMFTKNMRRAA